MSEQEGVNTTTASPAGENLIPKQRLDELIQRERAARTEAESLRQLVHNLVPKPQPSEPKDSARMAKMKEEDPEMYAQIKSLQHNQRRLNATIFAQNDALDKKNLVDTVGLDRANSNYSEIERIIDTARKNNNYTMTRVEAFLLLKGQEALHKERTTPAAPQASYEAKPSTTDRPGSRDAPPSDIDAQGATSSAARTDNGERDWESWANKNSNFEF